ncbi:hypothetical protein SDC9_176941 [bioreactor metagenome]|uniref:Uncharacterized protein n=1 Tax=bioreactor metagenome TaxID=1076179 RepID=A0A645GRL0_9ZZZZ
MSVQRRQNLFRQKQSVCADGQFSRGFRIGRAQFPAVGDELRRPFPERFDSGEFRRFRRREVFVSPVESQLQRAPVSRFQPRDIPPQGAKSALIRAKFEDFKCTIKRILIPRAFRVPGGGSAQRQSVG